jgi:hypothetical protein
LIRSLGTFSQPTAASSRRRTWRVKALAKVNTLAGRSRLLLVCMAFRMGFRTHTNKAAKKFIVAVKEMTVKEKPVLDGSGPFVV